VVGFQKIVSNSACPAASSVSISVCTAAVASATPRAMALGVSVDMIWSDSRCSMQL
jgi:hypothetical protein